MKLHVLHRDAALREDGKSSLPHAQTSFTESDFKGVEN